MQIGVITLFPHLMLCEDGEKAEQMKKGFFFLSDSEEGTGRRLLHYSLTASAIKSQQ